MMDRETFTKLFRRIGTVYVPEPGEQMFTPPDHAAFTGRLWELTEDDSENEPLDFEVDDGMDD